MTRILRRAAPIAALLLVAGVCGFLSYAALVRRPAGDGGWARAVATARRAGRTKAELPAVRIRDDAARQFLALARSGPAAARSRAALLAGLLEITNAGADSGEKRRYLIEAAATLRRALRLDAGNDDAAYDLELLLARAKKEGKPIPQPPPPAKRNSTNGRPGASPPGTGY